MYANVIVEIGAKNLDKTFLYRIPPVFRNRLNIGYRVRVPFGRKILEGFILNITDDIETFKEYELRDIIGICDDGEILNKEMIELGEYISNRTLCSKILAYQAMLPKALKAQVKTNIKVKESKYICLNKEDKEIIEYINDCRYQKQIELLKKLLKDKEIKITRIEGHIKTLEKKELIRISQKEDYRYNYEVKNTYKEITLNDSQRKVVEEVNNNLNKEIIYLLYGVTGSGKTEVYMNIISKVINDGKKAIMLVPEISLTPQIVDRFINRFGSNVAILHSGLTDTERYDEYRKIRENKVSIVVGARSAIFAPVTNLGVIIIDEEHSSSYKQDINPRYDAKDIAIWRSKYYKCPVIMGSATPTLESFARAGNHVYKLLVMDKRANNGSMPEVNIVDMKEEVKKGNFILSQDLKEKIEEKLNKKEQVILLLNRRGYSSMLSCSSCGEVFKCPRCDISLTYHKTNDVLRCHYCGYATKKFDICPKCKSTSIKDYGLGTEKLEEELSKVFNNARIVRMDTDTTAKRGMHEKIIEDFGNYKYDILLGTQMIAKGLDFPLVTLVGVINADMSLNIPDFRSAERTFQLLCQVSGRAGRSDRKGEVIIQTYNNDHYSIVLSKTHDYINFYKEEMKLRKELKYPPYYYITLLKISSKDYDYGTRIANKIGEHLRRKLSKDYIILGPTMANVFRINNIYSFQCIIKYRNDIELKKVLKEIDDNYKIDTKVKVEIDVNPMKL